MFQFSRMWQRTEPTNIKQKKSVKYYYDLHEDIWKRGVEINRREIKMPPDEIIAMYDLQQDILASVKQRQLKNKHDDAISLYDLHLDIWSLRKKPIAYENEPLNPLHKQKPVSPKQSRGNNPAVTPTPNKFSRLFMSHPISNKCCK